MLMYSLYITSQLNYMELNLHLQPAYLYFRTYRSLRLYLILPGGISVYEIQIQNNCKLSIVDRTISKQETNTYTSILINRYVTNHKPRKQKYEFI